MLWLCWVNSSFGRYIENKSFGHRGFRAVMQFLAKCPLSLDTGGCHIVTVSQKADPTSRILVYSETCRLPLSGFTHIACGLKATVPPAELSKVSFCLRLCTHMLKAGVRWILPNRILKFPPPLRTRVIWCSCPNVGIYWIGSTNPPLCHTERLPVVCARKLGAQHMESIVPAAQWVEPQRPMESPKVFYPHYLSLKTCEHPHTAWSAEWWLGGFWLPASQPLMPWVPQIPWTCHALELCESPCSCWATTSNFPGTKYMCVWHWVVSLGLLFKASNHGRKPGACLDVTKGHWLFL